MKKVVSTDGIEPPIAEPNSVVLPITPCAEKLPALTSKESINDTRIKKLINYESYVVAAAGVEPATFAL